MCVCVHVCGGVWVCAHECEFGCGGCPNVCWGIDVCVIFGLWLWVFGVGVGVSHLEQKGVTCGNELGVASL